MNHPRDEIRLTVLCICVIAVASGPLVHGIDLTAAQPSSTLSTVDSSDGSLTVQETEFAPSGYRLTRGISGSGIYKLRTPTATVRLRSVTGNVLLIYRLEIPELHYMTQSDFVVSRTSQSRLRLSIREQSIAADRISKRQYPAQVTLLARSDGSSRVLNRSNVTVDVSQ